MICQMFHDISPWALLCLGDILHGTVRQPKSLWRCIFLCFVFGSQAKRKGATRSHKLHIKVCQTCQTGLWNSDSISHIMQWFYCSHDLTCQQELWHQRSWTLVHVEEELLCLQICVMWFYFKSCAVTIICLLYLTFNLLLLDESNDIQYLSCIHYHVMTSWTHKIQDNWGYILGVSLT